MIFCGSCNDSFEIQTEELEKGMKRVEANITNLKESLKSGWQTN